jgi:putative flavoprotein involved in K+ transport
VTSTDVDVLVVGAGHAGLGVAARLRARSRSPLIVEADERIGETWRRRWASLRLFTPRFVNGLPGMPFPEGDEAFPRKDEVADYQERYADWLRVPVHLGARVTRLRRIGDIFEATIAGEALRARHVVVATGAHQTPRIPPFASRLDRGVLQLHSSEYGRSGPLPDGPVVVVGARNSGAEIAVELARGHDTTLSIGTQPPLAPARWRSTRAWRVAQLRSWVLRGQLLPKWLPWPIGIPYNVEVDIARAERDHLIALRPRAVDARGDEVRFADGSTARPRTVVWASGFRNDDSWIDVPSGEDGLAVGPYRRGPVPGLWVVRASLLASLHWGALDAAADIARSR